MRSLRANSSRASAICWRAQNTARCYFARSAAVGKHIAMYSSRVACRVSFRVLYRDFFSSGFINPTVLEKTFYFSSKIISDQTTDHSKDPRDRSSRFFTVHIHFRDQSRWHGRTISGYTAVNYAPLFVCESSFVAGFRSVARQEDVVLRVIPGTAASSFHMDLTHMALLGIPPRYL